MGPEFAHVLFQMTPLSYRKMDFEEFCAAAISTYQLEALEGWEQIASTAFEYFEQEGNRVISLEELARVFSSYLFVCFALVSPFDVENVCERFFPEMQELNVGPTAHTILRDWIRSSDGKLSLLGYTKFLHGVTLRSANTRHR